MSLYPYNKALDYGFCFFSGNFSNVAFTNECKLQQKLSHNNNNNNDVTLFPAVTNPPP